MTSRDNTDFYNWLSAANISEIEEVIYEIRDTLNQRLDINDIVIMVENNDIVFSREMQTQAIKFCKRKAPQSQE